MGEPSTHPGTNASVEPTEPQRGGGGISLLWLLALPVLYVLSVGPAARHFQIGRAVFAPPKAFLDFYAPFYAPLTFLANKSPTVRSALDWYVEQWVPPVFAPSIGPPPPTFGTSTN